MAQFYGTIAGKAKTKATREGSAESGLTTQAAGWGGAIEVELRQDKDGADVYEVHLIPWQNSGGNKRVLAAGVLDANL